MEEECNLDSIVFQRRIPNDLCLLRSWERTYFRTPTSEAFLSRDNEMDYIAKVQDIVDHHNEDRIVQEQLLSLSGETYPHTYN
jgi:hypothetical protein